MGAYERKQSGKNNQAKTTKPKQPSKSNPTQGGGANEDGGHAMQAGGGYLARSARTNASSTASNLGRRQQLPANICARKWPTFARESGQHLRAKVANICARKWPAFARESGQHLRGKAGFHLPVTKEESPTLRAALAGVREGEGSLEAEGLSGDRAMSDVKRLRQTSNRKQGESRFLERGYGRRMGGRNG
jgi:hypothetical protein